MRVRGGHFSYRQYGMFECKILSYREMVVLRFILCQNDTKIILQRVRPGRFLHRRNIMP